MSNSSAKFNRVIQMIYPFLAYFIVYNCMIYVFKSYLGDTFPAIIYLGFSSVITTVVVYLIYRNMTIVKPAKYFEKDTILKEIGMVILIVALGVVLNVVFTKLGLLKLSDEYVKANAVLYSGSIIMRVVVNCVLTPILEELVFRGCICGQMKLWHGIWPAVLVSGLVFGIIHKNPVQIVYAMIMGFALGILYCKTDKLHLCVVAHGLTNFIMILVTAQIIG